MKLFVEEATSLDLDAITDLHLRYYESIGQTKEDVRKLMNRDHGLILVAKNEARELVGYLSAAIEGNQSYAEWIGVKYERMGIGSKLGLHYLEECKARKINWIRATTRNRFKVALMGYIKHGFDIYGVYQGSDGELMIQLRKAL